MSHICEFFSDWFIRKAIWSTPVSIKSNIFSLKKFYKLMVELNYASKEDYLEMLDDIKYEKDSWISACKAYNSGEEDWRRDIFKISFLLIFFFN